MRACENDGMCCGVEVETFCPNSGLRSQDRGVRVQTVEMKEGRKRRREKKERDGQENKCIL